MKAKLCTDCKFYLPPDALQETKDTLYTTVKWYESLAKSDKEEIAKLKEASRLLEAENKWFREAQGVRDAEDQLLIDKLKKETEAYRKGNDFQRQEDYRKGITVGKASIDLERDLEIDSLKKENEELIRCNGIVSESQPKRLDKIQS